MAMQVQHPPMSPQELTDGFHVMQAQVNAWQTDYQQFKDQQTADNKHMKENTAVLRQQLDVTLVPTMNKLETTIKAMEPLDGLVRTMDKDLRETMNKLKDQVNPIIEANLVANVDKTMNELRQMVAPLVTQISSLAFKA